MTTALTTTERKLFAKCERTIKKGLGTFREVGSALLTIRERHLFQATHDTFKAYCQAKWSFSDSRARQLISAAKTAESVTTVTVENERQARSLTSALKVLPPEQQEACQADYREECERTNEEPTAEGLQEAVRLYQADNVPYEEAPDGEIDAPESDPTETPAPSADAPVRTPESPCEVTWDIVEDVIDKGLGRFDRLPKKERDMARASLAARLEAKVEEIRSES